MKHQTFFEAFAELNETQATRFEALLANLQAGSHAGASTALTPYQGIFAGTFALVDDAHFVFSGISTGQQPMPLPDSEVEHYPSQVMPLPDSEVEHYPSQVMPLPDSEVEHYPSQVMPLPDGEVEHYPSQEMPSPDGERGSGLDDSGHERPDDGPRGGVTTIPGHIGSGVDDHGDTQLEGPIGILPREIPLLMRGSATAGDAITNGDVDAHQGTVWEGHTDVDLPQPQQEVMVGHSAPGDLSLPQDTFGTAGPMVPPEGPVTLPYDVEGPGRTLPTPADTGAGDLPTPHDTLGGDLPLPQDTFGTAGPMVPPVQPVTLPYDVEGPGRTLPTPHDTPDAVVQNAGDSTAKPGPLADTYTITYHDDVTGGVPTPSTEVVVGHTRVADQGPLDESPMRPGPSLVEDSRTDGRPESNPLDDSDMRPGPSLDTHNPNVEPMNPPAHGADGVHDQLNPGVHVFDQLNPSVSDSFDFSQVAAAQEGFNDWGATFTGDALAAETANLLDAIVYSDSVTGMVADLHTFEQAHTAHVESFHGF